MSENCFEIEINKLMISLISVRLYQLCAAI